ncbi:MAG: NAD-dependent epimerase/dehydratase family protein [Patescibacteria group bacterium]
MKVLVTGGEGFLGSHLVDALIARGDAVVVVDHRQKNKHRFPNPKAIFYPIAFGDPQMKEVLLAERPDAIAHLAAQISVTRSIENPVMDAERNILDSLQLLQSASAAGVRKLVFASSGGAIYGDHPKRPTPLLDNAQPLSPYGVAKQSFERYLHYFKQQHGLDYVSLRFSNLFGARQQVTKPVGEGNVISLFLDRMLVTGEPITIFGDGTSSRDFLYIDDAIQAILKSFDQPFVGAVNVGTGKATTVTGLYAALTEIHGSIHPVINLPYRKGEVMHSVIHPGTAKKLLNWQAKVPFKTGLEQTYAWYKDYFGK